MKKGFSFKGKVFANGNIVKIRDVANHEFIGVILEQNKDRLLLFITTGYEFDILQRRIQNITFTKNLTPAARRLLKDYYQAYTKFQAEKERYEKASKPYLDTMHCIDKNALLNAMGLLTEEEFIREFLKHIPNSVRIMMEQNEFDYKIYNNRLSIEKRVDIQQYFKPCSFVYEEYDRTLNFTNDCKKDKHYQAYIKKYQCLLPGIKTKPYVGLGLGDKDWLSCTTSYDIHLKKPLTAAYAKELGKKF